MSIIAKKNENILKNAKNSNLVKTKRIKLRLKGARFLHLAFHETARPSAPLPVSYVTGYDNPIAEKFC